MPVNRLTKILAILVVATSLTSCGGDPEPDPGRSSGGLGSGLGTETSDPPTMLDTIDEGCTSSHPSRVNMVDNLGTAIEDLHECVTTSGLNTQLFNTSSDKVWFLSAPRGYSYWTPAQDDDESLTVQIFRQAIRSYLTTPGRQPLLTLEPGTTMSLDKEPAVITLEQSSGEQAAWQATSLAVSTAEKKGKAAARRLLVKGSRTRAAVVTCAESGYAAGKTLTSKEQDPALRLADLLGLRGNAETCARSIDEAAKIEPEGEITLTSEDLVRTTREPTWLSKVNTTIEESEKTLRFLAEVH
jgi:hypothetical protein